VRRTTLAALVVLAGAAIFALGGGEYSTLDWLELRRQERAESEAIARLEVEVDSLAKYAERVKTDRRLQERIAREDFGMIRKGEFLYRIVTDSLDGQ
jgi:cell division protein FtsB